MKTAMQELEYKLKDNLKWIVMNADYELMDKLFKEGFEKEKEQIIEASKNGISHGYTEGVVFGTNPRDYIVKWSEHYYNQTYKPETI